MEDLIRIFVKDICMDELFSLCVLFLEHNLPFYQRSTLSLIDVAVVAMRNTNLQRDPLVLLPNNHRS